VNDDVPEPKFPEIAFVLEALVGGHQNVAAALGLGNQLGIRQSTPIGFSDSQHLIIRESLPQTRINALV
jgi:hypothetical protein